MTWIPHAAGNHIDCHRESVLHGPKNIKLATETRSRSIWCSISSLIRGQKWMPREKFGECRKIINSSIFFFWINSQSAITHGPGTPWARGDNFGFNTSTLFSLDSSHLNPCMCKYLWCRLVWAEKCDLASPCQTTPSNLSIISGEHWTREHSQMLQFKALGKMQPVAHSLSPASYLLNVHL